MSGHSKWSTIKRKKGAIDARRGKIFTKLIREIATAARMGGADPDGNPRLRLAIDKARSANMPRDNITRAIKKGAGGTESETYEAVVYEGYGPGGAALFVEVLTDNKNRAVGELRYVLSKHGGNLGASGCVAYLFDRRGLLSFDRGAVGEVDGLLEAALEGEAEDVLESEDTVEVVTAFEGLESTKIHLAAAGYEAARANVTMQPSTTVQLEGKQAEQMLRLTDALEDLDDVQNVYSNYDISEEEMSRLAS